MAFPYGKIEKMDAKDLLCVLNRPTPVLLGVSFSLHLPILEDPAQVFWTHVSKRPIVGNHITVRRSCENSGSSKTSILVHVYKGKRKHFKII